MQLIAKNGEISLGFDNVSFLVYFYYSILKYLYSEKGVYLFPVSLMFFIK